MGKLWNSVKLVEDFPHKIDTRLHNFAKMRPVAKKQEHLFYCIRSSKRHLFSRMVIVFYCYWIWALIKLRYNERYINKYAIQRLPKTPIIWWKNLLLFSFSVKTVAVNMGKSNQIGALLFSDEIATILIRWELLFKTSTNGWEATLSKTFNHLRSVCITDEKLISLLTLIGTGAWWQTNT